MAAKPKAPDAPPVPDKLTSRSLPADLPGVPEAVREATHAVHATEARVAAVAAELRAKQATVRVSGRVDRDAAAAAERAGEPIPAATRPALIAEARELERQLDAAKAAAKTAARAQDAAVMATHGEWHAAALAEADARLGELDGLLADLDGLHDRLAVAGAVVAALDQMAADGGGLAINWPTPGYAADSRRQALGQLDGRFNRGAMVRADAGHLLAALEVLARRARGAAGTGAGTGHGRASWDGADDAEPAKEGRAAATFAAGLPSADAAA